MDKIVLFDGECNLCDHSVLFIIKRDDKECFQFASIQSDIGKTILRQLKVPSDINSLILISGKQYYKKSSAALRICKELNGFWKMFYLLIVVPRPIRDIFYTLIARNRHKWFGKKDSCKLPTTEMKNRFL